MAEKFKARGKDSPQIMKLTFGDTQPPESENKWGKKRKKGEKKEKIGDERKGKGR